MGERTLTSAANQFDCMLEFQADSPSRVRLTVLPYPRNTTSL